MIKPIHKFNNGNEATICNYCRTIISIGKFTNDLYCNQCLNRIKIVKLEEEFNTLKKFHEQINKEVHQNNNNLNK